MVVDTQELDNQLRISVHEAVCAERYEGINTRLERIERIMIGAAGLIITALATIAWGVIQH